MWLATSTPVFGILFAVVGVTGLQPQSVLVCGPARSSSGEVTVSELVASQLERNEVVRWDGEREIESSAASKCDAAVICGDGTSSLEQLVNGMLSARRGMAPSSVVLVLGDESSSSEKKGGLAALLEKEPMSAEALAGVAADAGAKRVAVVRHGPLFGGDSDAPAFLDGLKKAPELSADFARRAVRLAPWREDSSAQQPTRRATVARVAAETLCRLEEKMVDLEVKSALGPEPTEEEWRVCVTDALAASDPRCAFRLSTAKRDVAPALLQDWILNTWGPLVLRGLSAKYSTVGARPVAFDSKGDDVVLRWEEFDGKQVSTVGTLTFSLLRENDVFLVTRESDKPLPGEVQLVDSLADALPSQFPLVVEEEEKDEETATVEAGEVPAAETEEEIAPQDSTAVESSPPEEEEEQPDTPPPVKAAAPKKRRSSVRARTSPAAAATAATPKDED